MIKENVLAYFFEKFKEEPLLIFSPGRINIIGEHTDYNDGFVFPAAINKGIYTALSKSNSNYSSICALDMNECFELKLDELNVREVGNWKNYLIGILSVLKKQQKPIGNFNMVFAGNIPNGSGLSSSAALENSIIFGLNELFQLGLSKKEMIFISQKAEHDYVGVNCGIMDQYASMFGQKNKALLLDCKTIEAIPYDINMNGYKIVLINSNVHHSLAETAYNDRRQVCEMIASKLNVSSLREVTLSDLDKVRDEFSEENIKKAAYVINENMRVLLAAEAIENNNIKLLGELLYETHYGLQNHYKVSCHELDFLVNKAKENSSVVGSRMMGGGFGGCTINIVESQKKDQFIETIKESYFNQFNKHCSVINIKLGDGTHLESID